MSKGHLSYVVVAVVSLVVLVVAVIFFTNYQDTTFRCAIGECPTNIQTGVKRCSSTQSLSYDPATEVCNSADRCDNPITSYAVLPTGGTDDRGVCATEECRCSTTAACPSWISAAFKLDDGLYTQRVLDQTNSIPLGYQCYVAQSEIQALGCYIPEGGDVQAATTECLQLYPECGQIPLCRAGVLAYVDDGLASRYACVNSSTCPCGTTTILNPITGSVTCE